MSIKTIHLETPIGQFIYNYTTFVVFKLFKLLLQDQLLHSRFDRTIELKIILYTIWK